MCLRMFVSGPTVNWVPRTTSNQHQTTPTIIITFWGILIIYTTVALAVAEEYAIILPMCCEE